jgi:hypothetical protein
MPNPSMTTENSPGWTGSTEPEEKVCHHVFQRYVLTDAWGLDRSLSDRKQVSSDPAYDPPDVWYVGQECTICGAQGYAVPR